jgi:hypothetical protein
MFIYIIINFLVAFKFNLISEHFTLEFFFFSLFASSLEIKTNAKMNVNEHFFLGRGHIEERKKTIKN